MFIGIGSATGFSSFCSIVNLSGNYIFYGHFRQIFTRQSLRALQCKHRFSERIL